MHPSLRVFGAIILLSLPLNAQTAPDILPPSGEGREFWLCFQKNFRAETIDETSQTSRPSAPLALSLVLTSQYSTNVAVEVPGIGFTRKLVLAPGGVQMVQIPPVAEVTGSDYLERLSVHVTADAPVSAIALNTRSQTTDTYFGIPVEALGNAYRVACYGMLQNDLLAQLAVVATQDSTVVRIVPTAAVKSQEPLPLVDPNAPRSPVVMLRPRPDSTKMRPRGKGAEVREATIPTPPEHAAGRDSLQRAMQDRRKSADSMRAAMEARRKEKESRRAEIAVARPRPIRPDSLGPHAARTPESEALKKYERPAARPRTSSVQSIGAGDTITVRLSRGEVFQLMPRQASVGSSDLTGTLVSSNRPIAVFSGHNCAYVPDITVKACNMLAEQIPPLSAWGRRHVVGGLKERSSYVVRVVASASGTEITVNGSPVLDREGKRLSLQAGGWHELSGAKGDLEIVTSRAALVVQYSTGYGNDNVGDPMMVVVPPVEQFGTVFTTATITGPDWRHYVNVIASTGSLNSLSIDGDVVDATLFSKIAGTEFSVGAVPLANGRHVLASSAPFGFYSYGFNSFFDAYGHGGGQLYEDLEGGDGETGGTQDSPELGSLNGGR